MELLAPAGNRENFQVALEAGADAVYIGAPQLNARNLGRDVSLEEIGGMVAYAHQNKKKVYVAINSLVRESDLKLLLHTLSFLEMIGPDGLIVQDMGLVSLARKYFPTLKLHGSTLMTVHNLAGLAMLEHFGCSRVVLARELTLQEISALIKQSPVEVEVFVHGAMCFSYSGLCLFSSYLGGKSGLRGNCVQPCRRKYSVDGPRTRTPQAREKEGYSFSMNDLEGLRFVPDLMNIGVASLKIEGRLRSANYVKNVVAAYRMVIDGAQSDDIDGIIARASELIPAALGRKTSSGFFLGPQPKDAISHYHSGNVGSYLGRLESISPENNRLFGTITLKSACATGERLRLHFEQSGERTSFTLTEMRAGKQVVDEARSNQRVRLALPDNEFGNALNGTIDVYRVDVRREQQKGERDSGGLKPLRLTEAQNDAVRRKARTVGERIGLEVARKKAGKPEPSPQKTPRKRGSSELWLRVDSPEIVFEKLPFQPNRYVFNWNRKALSRVGQLKSYLGRSRRDVTWALPPIVSEQATRQLIKDIRVLIRSGFRSFQLAHLSQREFFAGEEVWLVGDHTLNLLNSQAISLAFEQGLQGVQLSIESDRQCLQQMVEGYRRGFILKKGERERSARGQFGLTVYGAPPLFTARLSAPHFQYGKAIRSPKNELFVITKGEGLTQTRPLRPFSLLPYREELEQLGIDYFVVDLSGLRTGRKELDDLSRRITGKEKVPGLPTFNYLGGLE